MLADPRPQHVRAAARGATPKTPEARMFCDIHNLDGTPFEGDPRQVLRRNLAGAHEQGLHVLRRPRHGVLLLRRRRRRRRRRSRSTRAAYFDLTTTDVAGDAAQADDPHARGDGHPGRVQLPRGRPEPARDRPAPHRRADDGRQRDDVPARRHGGRRRRRACTPRSCPSRSRACRARACTPTSRCSRATTTRSTTPDDAVQPVEGRPRRSWPACCATPREITAITNQTVNCYKRLVPGFEAPVHVSLGPQQPQRPDPGADRQAGQARLATRIEYRSPDPACNPYLAFSRDAGRRPAGASRRATSCPPRPTPTCSRSTTSVLAKLGIDAAAAVAVRGARRDGALRARRRGARRAHLRVVPAQQAERVARLQDPRSRRSSSTAT